MTRTYAVGNPNKAVRLDDHTGPWVELFPTGDGDTQWNDVMNDPTNEDKVIIVGSGFQGVPFDAWGIQVSTDAGVTWTVPGGNWGADADKQIIWYELWYVDTNTIWVTGSEGRVALSTDGGATFNLVDQQIAAGAYFFTAGIHALDDQVAVVLGSPWPNVTQTELYVWKTVDGGANWTMLSGASLPPPTVGTVNEIGNANGLWMSPDQQKIVVGSGYNQYISTDGGATWTDVLQDHFRSGIHFTWFPSYDADPQFFRHVGGLARMVTESTDNAGTFTNTRSIVLGDSPVTIRGSHFYAPYDGYYTIDGEIFSTTDGAVSGVLSHTGDIQTVWNAVWTSVELPPYTPCFELTDCAGVLPSIFTQVDLTDHVGSVITLADETNHEIDGCWFVNATNLSCPDSEVVSIYRCYDDCETCLPAPIPPRVPKPRMVEPGYETGMCDPSIVEGVMCSYVSMMHKKMMGRRFDIEECCPKDNQKIELDYEKTRLLLITAPTLAPDPCDPQCLSYGIQLEIGESAVTTYINCNGDDIEEITDVLTMRMELRFCALDTRPPVSVVTHVDTTTDSYILEPRGACDIDPPVPPIDPPCSTYTVNYNGVGDIDYLDCDGNLVNQDLPNGSFLTVQFCGQSNQTLLPNGGFKGIEILEDDNGCNIVPCVMSYWEVTTPIGVVTSIGFTTCGGLNGSIIVPNGGVRNVCSSTEPTGGGVAVNLGECP